MRILFVKGTMAGWGGTTRVTCELANKFSESGQEVAILCPFGPSKSNFELSPSISITGLSLKQAEGKVGRFVHISWSIYNYCRQYHPDIVIIVDTIAYLFCLPWAWRLGAQFVCWEHFNLSTDNGSRFRVLARKAAARWSDAVVTLTERDAQAWRARYTVNGLLRAIWNPIPRFEKGPTAFEDRENIVLAAGRLTEQKGFDVLLRAWQQLSKAKSGWVLRIVGGGEDEQSLRHLADELGVIQSVIFVGQTKDMAQEYRTASIYVMSSRWEGLPMVLLEAQYFALPSVSTDCETGPRELLANGSGLLVSVDEPQELAMALEQLINDEHMRESMGRAAQGNVRWYSPDQVLRSWNQLLQDLNASM